MNCQNKSKHDIVAKCILHACDNKTTLHSVWMKKHCQWWTHCRWLVRCFFALTCLWNLFILIYSFKHFTIFYSIIQRLLYAFSTVSVFNVAQPAMRMRWFYYLFKQRFCSDIFYSMAVKASHFPMPFFLWPYLLWCYCCTAINH